MIFYATPNLLIRPKNKRIKPFRFNENGIYKTENPRLINALKKKFKFEEENICKCKKCDFETNNKGLLLAHYREQHKE